MTTAALELLITARELFLVGDALDAALKHDASARGTQDPTHVSAEHGRQPRQSGQ
jgi:hypothetical protein